MTTAYNFSAAKFSIEDGFELTAYGAAKGFCHFAGHTPTAPAPKFIGPVAPAWEEIDEDYSHLLTR